MKIIGLDVGSSSLGYSLRVGNEIYKKGVITFDSGMKKGQGGYSSPTKDRREARSKRRLIQARKYRKWELLKILLNGFVPLEKEELSKWCKYEKGMNHIFPENESFLKWLACDFSYIGVTNTYKNPYELRIKGIDTILHKHEFGRALYHLVQRRGYKNIGETDAETEKQIKRRSESGFQNALDNNRTIAEALKNEFLDKNDRARNQYPYREEYEHEFELICKGQGYDISKNKRLEYNDSFVESLKKAIIWQRPLRSQKGNIGKCTLEPSKLRCPISHPIYEIYRAWSYINTIKYTDFEANEAFLAEKERKLLFSFFLKQKKNFKFEDIKKFLDKNFKKVKSYNYPYNESKKEYDSTVAGMPVCDGLISVFGDKIKETIESLHLYNIGNAPKIVGNYSLFDLWHILFEFDKAHLEKFAAEKIHISNQKNKNEEEFNPFADLKNSITQGYADLSLKAMSKIIPFLKDGFLYNEAAILAKIPETIGVESWILNKETIIDTLKVCNNIYQWNKLIGAITNILIDAYKGLEQPYAYKDFKYELKKDDDTEIETACKNHFGEQKWQIRKDKNKILSEVRIQYQAFFKDEQRKYCVQPNHSVLFETLLKEQNIPITTDKLYHHSKKENLYGKTIIDKKTRLEILPEARIDSIKNPMFNKSLSILRKLINELIKNGDIDEQTEVVIELARDLNDNNKRIAIERYQNERNKKRNEYRKFLNEFKVKKNLNFNIEESLAPFELWNEQIFAETEDENKNVVFNKTRKEIIDEKNDLTRYELWTEQKGQCMYTGKMISITKLFSSEIDIEHTIPRSILPDNTMANKTVAFKNYNTDIKNEKLPIFCPNYKIDTIQGTSILPRLEKWIKIRDDFKGLYESRAIKTINTEDEAAKNKRIQEKHYFKMHFDYWNDKVYRFLADNVNDKWVRRQLVDTQMIGKYAREYLKTYFNKVSVQKGIITSEFRKIYGFQEADEIKNRNKHTHHAIDASVLTLIPLNSNKKISILKEMYKMYETTGKQYTEMPFKDFNSQKLIEEIENTTLIYNYEKDNILKQTAKNKRKRGKLEKLKDKDGSFILDDNGNEIQIKLAGNSIRSTLFAQTFIAKIMDVERDENDKPIKEPNGNWKFKKEKFAFVKRVPVKDCLSKIKDIVDPVIRKLVEQQKNNDVIKDYQCNTIRHVRIKTGAGKEVKERVNYKSEHNYKNYYYSEAGSIPYAILIQRSNNGIIEREMIPVASFEIAEMFDLYLKEKSIGNIISKFDIQKYLVKNKIDISDIKETKLLKVGQKIIVLKSDKEYENRNKIDFQNKRLYVITKFSEGSIWLQYHLESNPKEIDKTVKNEKDRLVQFYENKYNIPEITEDVTIKDNKARKDDFEDRKYKFSSISDFRLDRLVAEIGIEKTKKIMDELSQFKTQAATIEVEGKTPLLKTSSKNWNFLYENYDFTVSILGKLEMM
ncbi:MAG: hypothetical protein EAZ53_16335 [Bacteroidetes bacterium]|nr:MAG: hypothetical protein EAZ53_16335 [Bacteroidota bacterium]